jgi:hypothetical protein
VNIGKEQKAIAVVAIGGPAKPKKDVAPTTPEPVKVPVTADERVLVTA